MRKTSEKGITLIALVITIIVLLILAGVSITMLTGQNSILTRAVEAEFKTKAAEIKEQLIIQNITYMKDKKGVNDLKNQIEMQMQSLKTGVKNCEDAISMFGKGEGELSNVQGILQRIRELCVVFYNSENEYESIKQEMDQLIQELNNIAETTSFSEIKLLDGSFNKNIVFGDSNFNYGNTQITIEDMHWEKLYGESEIDYSNIEKVIENINSCISKVSEIRSKLSAKQNAFDCEISYLNNIIENTKNLFIGAFGDETTGYFSEEEMTNHVKSWATTIKILETAEGSLSNIQDELLRIEELANLITEDYSHSTEDIPGIQIEINEFLSLIESQFTYTKIGDIKLFDGTFPHIEKNSLDILGIKNLDFKTEEKAQSSKKQIENAIEIITDERTSIDEYYKNLLNKSDEKADTNATFDIVEYISIDIPEKYKNKFQIINGQLTYIGNDNQEKNWSNELGIPAK